MSAASSRLRRSRRMRSRPICRRLQTCLAFALKTDIPTVPPPPDLSGVRTKTDIPDVSGFAHTTHLPDVSGFLTAAALAPFALKTDIKEPDLRDFARRSDIPTLPDLSVCAKKSDIPALPDLSGYARKSDIPHVPPAIDLSPFALKSELPEAPDLSGYVRTSDLPVLPDFSAFARKADLPPGSGLLWLRLEDRHPEGAAVTRSDALCAQDRSAGRAGPVRVCAQEREIPAWPDFSDFARKSDVPSLPDLSPFALKTDLPVVPPLPDFSGFALKSDIPSVPDFSGFALKSDLPALPDFSAFARKTDIPQVPAPPDLSGVALKSELPDVSRFITADHLNGFARTADRRTRSERLRTQIRHPGPSRSLGLRTTTGDSGGAGTAGLQRLCEEERHPKRWWFHHGGGSHATRVEVRHSDARPPRLREEERVARGSGPVRFARLSGRAGGSTSGRSTAYVRKTDLPAPPDLSRVAFQVGHSADSRHAGLERLRAPVGLAGSVWCVRVRELESQLRERDAVITRPTDSLGAEQAKRESEIARLEGLLRDALARLAAAAPAAAPIVRDDLKKVYGIGPVLAKRLYKMGITTFAQIARWSDSDIDTIEPKLDTIAGRIRREGWVPDSARLHQENAASESP